MSRDSRASVAWAVVACLFGLVHAAFSAYWAFGGRALLDTVGSWAVQAVAQGVAVSAVLLGGVALGKTAAAVIPLMVALGLLPFRRLWRAISWIGAAGLTAYGAVNVVVASAVLAGLIRPEGGYDEAAMVGHALLWDPLFLVWGAALLMSLVLSRAGRPSPASTSGGRGSGSTRASRWRPRPTR